MKTRYIGICVLIVLCMSSLTYSQETPELISAFHQIDQLKDGTLLIKLNTQSARIDHRLKVGQEKRAQELMEEVENEHEAIISAFKANYTFSNYYFFLSDDSGAVITKKDYKHLFLEKNQSKTSPVDVKNPFVLSLGVPPGYSTIDKYRFILHALSDGGIKPIAKSMPKVFKTQSKKLFSNDYDFDRAVIKMQESLNKFYIKSH